ncbi:hypothetical protein C2845_PM01G42370 [Panicum miliaceum]|uniref:Uncharacterized protein n=1 Tax=Panicum miliaceum TaxID=4540 RepID=A0A3L6TI51_PANMI|nr:hypothetical protein C2845_PM01G42370 [Panicum miliaceum]
MAAPAIDEADERMIMALRELVEDDEDDGGQGLVGDLRDLRSIAAALEGAESLTSQSWNWVENVERIARRAAGSLASEAADIQRGLSLVARRPGEEAFAAVLRRQAASTGAGLADAEWLAAATRRLRERELRRLAVAEHVAHPDTAAFLGYIARETDASLARGEAPAPEELALAPQVEAAAVRMEQWLAALAARLRRARRSSPRRRRWRPRWRGRRPRRTRRAPPSRRSPLPCAASGTPAAARRLLPPGLQGLATQTYRPSMSLSTL